MIDMQNVSNNSIKIIGAELKRRRVKRSKTLVNLSSVCSVSYISKIENGKIIPKIHVLEELCIEQGISKEELQTLLEVDNLIEKTIEAFFWNNKEKISEIYNSVKYFDNYKVNFIKIFYEMSFYHWEKVDRLLNSIMVIKENMDDLDLELFSYLQMCYENEMNNYPKVYELYSVLNYCKNSFLAALASKEMFVAVAKYGFESPVEAYDDFSRKYQLLFNNVDSMMYDLYIESLINLEYTLSESVKKSLSPTHKVYYAIAKKDEDFLDEVLKEYKPNDYERMLITTFKKDYSQSEKVFTKLKPNKLTAYENLISRYCSLINTSTEEEIADYIINVAIPYARRINDGFLFRMFLKKLSHLSFSVGKYKVVVNLNLIYFDMKSKCIKCLH